jgi:hypothetical protein
LGAGVGWGRERTLPQQTAMGIVPPPLGQEGPRQGPLPRPGLPGSPTPALSMRRSSVMAGRARSASQRHCTALSNTFGGGCGFEVLGGSGFGGKQRVGGEGGTLEGCSGREVGRLGEAGGGGEERSWREVWRAGARRACKWRWGQGPSARQRGRRGCRGAKTRPRGVGPRGRLICSLPFALATQLHSWTGTAAQAAAKAGERIASQQRQATGSGGQSTWMRNRAFRRPVEGRGHPKAATA